VVAVTKMTKSLKTICLCQFRLQCCGATSILFRILEKIMPLFLGFKLKLIYAFLTCIVTRSIRYGRTDNTSCYNTGSIYSVASL
jgi:hypothetical protein